MPSWKTVFRNEKAREENKPSYACSNCSTRYGYELHETGTPPDKACQCEACTGKTPSHGFKENWEGIDWSTFESQLDWEGKKGGHRVGRVKR